MYEVKIYMEGRYYPREQRWIKYEELLKELEKELKLMARGEYIQIRKE